MVIKDCKLLIELRHVLMEEYTQHYFEYILRKHSENIDNPSIRIYVNKIENRITFKIKTGYYLEF